MEGTMVTKDEELSEAKQEGQMAEIVFPCEGKCRICPFPGANCAKEQMLSQKRSKPKKIKSRKN